MLQSGCWVSSNKYKVRWKGFCCSRNLEVLGDLRLSRVLRAATAENVPDRILRLSKVLRPATLGCVLFRTFWVVFRVLALGSLTAHLACQT